MTLLASGPGGRPARGAPLHRRRPRRRRARRGRTTTGCSRSNARWTRATASRPPSPARWPTRWELHRLERQQPTLENVFLRYVTAPPSRGDSGMNGMLAVYRKELASYFRSPIAYYVVAVFLLGTGYFFLYNIFLTGDDHHGRDVPEHGHPARDAGRRWSPCACSPANTAPAPMELLMTLPLAPWQIVPGKYPRRGDDPPRDGRRHPHRPRAALPVRRPGDHDDPGRLHRASCCSAWRAWPSASSSRR